MTIVRGNLFEGDGAPASGERFEELAALAGARIERIVSSAAPDEMTYDQDDDEWVVLLRGEAVLEVEGQPSLSLRAGDWLVLPAGVRHRVRSTTTGALWLAVHAARGRPASSGTDS